MIAERLDTYKNRLQVIQGKLTLAAKRGRQRKFGILYDKVCWMETLEEAWRRVRANKGAPGVDGKSIHQIEAEYGVDRFLKEIQEELINKSYHPEKVRRVWIDKPGKKEKRPLGIPTAYVKCTQHQEAFGICENYTSFSCFSWAELSSPKNDEYIWHGNYIFERPHTREFCCAL